MVFKGSGHEKQWSTSEKINANLELEKKRPKIQQKSILGGSGAPFGRGLGWSWASFGCFWPSLGRFLAIQNWASFRHWPKMGSKRASGGIWDPSGDGFGRIWRGFGRVLRGFSSIFGCTRNVFEGIFLHFWMHAKRIWLLTCELPSQLLKFL